MIYVKDLPKFKDMSESFEYLQGLNTDKKYKLPYMYQHYLRRGSFIIDDNVEDVLLSTWMFNTRAFNFKKFTVSIMEFPKSYVMSITQEGIGLIGKTKWYEQLNHVPNWIEIEYLCGKDF
ncbi:hypothetical protein [Clostridium sp.]|uniref:hypothetical protein n=1 Tax=Clostridium sp. TaxID=1506 RepID=UPI003F416C5A